MSRPTILEAETEEILQEYHIQEVKKEKALRTSTLPSLAQRIDDPSILCYNVRNQNIDSLSNPHQTYEYTSTTKLRYTNASGGGSSGCASSTGSPISIGGGAGGDAIIHTHALNEQQPSQSQHSHPFQQQQASSGTKSESQRNLAYVIIDPSGLDIHRQKAFTVRIYMVAMNH